MYDLRKNKTILLLLPPYYLFLYWGKYRNFLPPIFKLCFNLERLKTASFPELQKMILLWRKAFQKAYMLMNLKSYMLTISSLRGLSLKIIFEIYLFKCSSFAMIYYSSVAKECQRWSWQNQISISVEERKAGRNEGRKIDQLLKMSPISPEMIQN